MNHVAPHDRLLLQPGRVSDDPLAKLSAAVAALLAVILPLIPGLNAGWSGWRIGAYLGLAGAYLLLIWLFQGTTSLSSWLCTHPWPGLILAGLLGLGLVTLSGDGFIQPVVFTVPFVFGLIMLSLPQAAALGVGYLALLALGLALTGTRNPTAISFTVGVYGALLLFMAGFVRQSQAQRAARLKADALAAELAAERDRLAALAAENARLAAANAQTATLAERNRIARELHDTIAQGLTAITMQLEAAERAFERDPARAQQRLARARSLARETLVEVRQSVWSLAAPLVEGPALDQALHELSERFTERTGVPARYTHEGDTIDLTSEQASQILRIMQEALQNVERHAAATAVTLGSQSNPDGTLQCWVHDNGRGFDPAAPVSASTGGGFGLISLHERARLIGAELTITSAPQHGTLVQLILPFPASSRHAIWPTNQSGS